MSDKQVGRIMWVDLTVPEAGQVKDFYTQVVGWNSEAVDMGEYSDFNMLPPAEKEAVAGVCHARGTNASLPPYWMIYIIVENAQQSADKCLELGGQIVVSPKEMGKFGRYCIIRDPAGAVCALFEPASSD